MSDDPDPTLDDDLRRWHKPTERGRWVRLPLSDKDIEVFCHMSIRRDADERQRARDLWPDEHVLRGISNFRASVTRINETASSLSGKPGGIINGPDTPAAGPEGPPQVRLHLLTEVPYAEVWVEDTQG